MENENDIRAFLAHLTTHFERQSEFVENATARLQSTLRRIEEMKLTNKAMAESLDRLEAVHKNS